MRLDNMRESSNVEDRRGSRGGGRSIGGTGGVPLKLGGGIGGIVLVLVLLWMGVPAQQLLQGGGSVILPGAGPSGVSGQSGPVPPGQEEEARLVRKVLGDTEDVWKQIFRESGSEYRPPTLVMFSGSVSSACGNASAASGPFYCPADEKVYIDLDFFTELRTRFGAQGDFAQAYVIAHEVGHHVQHILGATDHVHSARGNVSEKKYNDLSVRLELQADYLAGVWAHHANKQRNIIEAGDVEEALRCAAAIGDDRLQMRAQGYTVPDSFTHGTSAQRARWFKKGLESGNLNAGDTFKADQL
jgi:predicted metalloprotease